jgi:hypothetical protein
MTLSHETCREFLDVLLHPARDGRDSLLADECNFHTQTVMRDESLGGLETTKYR